MATANVTVTKNGRAMMSDVIALTPELARGYLDSMVKNRPLMENTVIGYADAICRGEWQVNGEALKFDEDERMIDGQHRCEAVILAGKPIDTLVVRGLKTKVFHTIDQHARRYVNQVLAIQGEKHYTTLAGALSWLHKYNSGRCNDSGAMLSTTQALSMLRGNTGLRDSAGFIRGECDKVVRFLSASAATFMHYVMAQAAPNKAAEFWRGVALGDSLPAGSPIYMLRERLISNRSSVAKAPIAHQVAWCIKAWNAFRAGRKLSRLAWQQNEEFPQV